MHICQDEILLLMSSVPGLLYLRSKIKSWLFKRKHKGCHCEDCNDARKDCRTCAQSRDSYVHQRVFEEFMRTGRPVIMSSEEIQAAYDQWKKDGYP